MSATLSVNESLLYYSDILFLLLHHTNDVLPKNDNGKPFSVYSHALCFLVLFAEPDHFSFDGNLEKKWFAVLSRFPRVKGRKSAKEVKDEYGEYLDEILYMPIVHLDDQKDFQIGRAHV